MTQGNFLGLESPEPAVKTPPAPEYAGRVLIDRAYANRSTLTKATGFIGDYDYTLNPYSGCAFGCQYCYATAFISEKPAPGEKESPYRRDNWGNWVRIKQNAVEQVRAAVALGWGKGGLNGKALYMSSVTDPYQPTERRTKQTNLILQELAKAQELGLVLQTRGPLVNNEKDIELCRQIAENGGFVQVNMTITTNDEAVRRAVEPTCPSYRQRLDAITALNDQIREISRYTACITMSPLLPTDNPEDFAADLVNSGIDRFIIQPVHTAQPNSRGFRAVTRNELVWQLAELWGYDKTAETQAAAETTTRIRYDSEYRKALRAILPVLRKANAMIGYGRIGFGRPWANCWQATPEQDPDLSEKKEEPEVD